MSELRWHPLLREWVAVAANRQDRPQMPKDWCPFDPGSGRVPDQFDVYIYPNDFAAFSLDAEPFSPETGLYVKTGARGCCDVVIYHPEHNLAPSQLAAEHWGKIVAAWVRRHKELAALADVQYVYIFENTGIAIGVTMPHPHGQIYAFPFVPPLVQRELDAAADYLRDHDECIYCRILRDELTSGERLVTQNADFAAFVPFFARWPGEIQICARRHFGAINELTEPEAASLAAMIKRVRMKYDNVWGFPMPLMMLLRQRPVKGEHPYFHFHVDFYPIQRSPTKLKYLAGVESGGGTFLNDTRAEDKAKELRETEPRD
ncbi:MAG TPA: galactose-1-phosphate uridylyltransferase [Bryobacteraceae bacterium]|nr:galactose-1-phosphate uridylyltransferase [Bryobacteraceae bacterium]